MVSLCSAHLPRCTISKCFNSCKMSLSAAEQRQTTPRSRDQCSRVQRGGAALLNKLLPSSFSPLQSLHAWCFACSMSCTVGSPGTGGACGCGPPRLSVDCCLPSSSCRTLLWQRHGVKTCMLAAVSQLLFCTRPLDQTRTSWQGQDGGQHVPCRRFLGQYLGHNDTGSF